MKRALSIAVAVIVCLTLLQTAAFAVSEQTSASSTKETAAGFDVTLLGANGNDANDDTDAIQKAMNQHDSVYIPDGTYYINVDRSLQTNTNQTLIMSDHAVLRALPSDRACTSVITVEKDTNVVISGGQIIGERYSHTGSTGEWGMGINVLGSDNVTISNITVQDCWGDGFYLGGSVEGDKATGSTNVKLENVIADNNRRQGLSITNATQVTVTGSIFKNTNGVAPEAGIDIEPNPGEFTGDITITNTQCYNNAGSGLDLMGCSERIEKVTVRGCSFSGNSAHGINIVNARELVFNDTVSSNNSDYGISIPRDTLNAYFKNITISGNRSRGVAIITTDQKSGTENIIFESSIFKNNSQNEVNGTDGVRIDNYGKSGYVKNISFKDCDFIDDQQAKTQRYGLTVGYSEGMSGITIDKECTFSGNISGRYVAGNALEIV
jgi:hypothetical protein